MNIIENDSQEKKERNFGKKLHELFSYYLQVYLLFDIYI